MLSYWEYDAWTQYDAIIIGAGIVGLSTAISLKARQPEWSVLVLERGLLPSGASTRNAGFACFGSLTEILSDMRKNGIDATVQLVEQRWRGLSLLRERIGDADMEYEQYGGYEVITGAQMPALDALEHVNTTLRKIFPKPPFVLRNDDITRFGFTSHPDNPATVQALVYSPFEGQIHSGKMMRTLTRRALECGVMIMTGAEAQSLHDEGNGVAVSVRHLDDNITLKAQRCAVCTNAFSRNISPDSGIIPARGQVLLTSPIPHLALRGVFHLDEGFFYFRNVTTPDGQCILLGGGRNLAFEEEETSNLELNEHIQNELERLLRTVIAPHHTFDIEHRWAGIMGFREDKLPSVQFLSPNVALGFACNGMGVALGSTIGDQTAALLDA